MSQVDLHETRAAETMLGAGENKSVGKPKQCGVGKGKTPTNSATLAG